MTYNSNILNQFIDFLTRNFGNGFFLAMTVIKETYSVTGTSILKIDSNLTISALEPIRFTSKENS